MSYLDDTEYNANDIIFDERVLNTDFIPRYYIICLYVQYIYKDVIIFFIL